MNQIVLTEGKNDLTLISKFHIQHGNSVETFKREDLNSKRPRNEQDNRIRTFLEPKCPYDILIKSEEGRPNLLKLIFSEIIFLIDETNKVTMVIDLDKNDGEALEQFLPALSREIESAHKGGGFEVNFGDPIYECSYLVALKPSVYKRNSYFGEFALIIFKPDLEEVASITGEENREEKDQKIESLLEKDEIQELLQDILLPHS